MVVRDVIKLRELLVKLVNNDEVYPIGVAYKLSKLITEINEIFKLLLDRLKLIYSDDVNFSDLSDEEQIPFNILLESEIDDYWLKQSANKLKMEELTDNDKALFTVKEMMFLREIIKD